MEKALIIIPARYGSTRFPGKPLVKIKGTIMIQRVYEQAILACPNVWVATDDLRIEAAVQKFGGNCIITSPDHKSGTDRIAEALGLIPEKNHAPIIVNIQGDEPFIKPEQISQLIDICTLPETQIATLIKKIDSAEDLFNPNKPKVVCDMKGNALYFSRNPIPHIRDVGKNLWHKAHSFFKHIGVYAYKKEILQKITKLQSSSLELAENLEQLRWLENNFTITTGITNYESPSIDTEEDLQKVLETLK